MVALRERAYDTDLYRATPRTIGRRLVLERAPLGWYQLIEISLSFEL